MDVHGADPFVTYQARGTHCGYTALMPPDWTVYIIRCSDGSLYTGITTDLERRVREHAEGGRGAKYFNGRLPEKVVYLEAGHDRSSASRREAAIKKLSREEKLSLLKSGADPA